MKNRQIQLSRLVPLFVIAIAVAIGLCVSVTAFIHVKIAVERSQKNNVQREMEGIVHDFSSFLNMRKLILRDYAEFPLITQTVMQPEKNFINIRDFMRGMSILGERYQMSLLDFEGNTIHARQKGPGFDYTSSPWLDEVMNGNIEGYAGISEKANKYFWCIAVPVKYNGFAEGVLVTEIPIEAVVEYFNYSERLKGMQLEVIHEDKSIFSTGKKLSVAPSDILIQEFGFVLRYRVDEQPIHAAISAMLVQIFAALLALTMAVVWISVYLGKRFLVFPLEKLLQQTTDLSEGNRVESVTITRNIWDIAELANRFNLMSERVQQREEALKESVEEIRKIKEMYRLIIETAGDAFVSINQNGRIVQWNRRAEIIFGWSLQEVKGSPLHEVIIPDRYRSAHVKGLKHYLATNEGPILNKRIEIEAVNRAGKTFPVELQVWPVKINRGVQFNAFISDISERKNAENNLKKSLEETRNSNQELKKAQSQLIQADRLASIGQLAAGVAHEINNPISFVTSNMNTLDKYVCSMFQLLKETGKLKAMIESDQGLTEAREHLKVVSRLEESLNLDFITKDIDSLMKDSRVGLERVKTIVSDLKTFARPGAEDKDMEFEDFEVIAEGAISIVWNELKYKVDLKKKFEDIPRVKCNPQQVGQVIINILVNAAQGIDGSGEISLHSYSKDDKVYLEISDTGAGMSQEVMDHIFDPFFTTKEVGKGTGLGMSISYDIIKKHSGDIKVSSVMGQGSTFIISLPI